MSEVHYSTGDEIYQVIGGDGETEAEKRERMVKELFDGEELDTKLHYIDEARWRWLYHWFGFEKDSDIVRKAAQRLVNKHPTGAEFSGDLAAAARVIRKKWAVVLRDVLWKHPSFHPFADTPKAGVILKTKFQNAYLEEESRNVPVQFIFRLSSSVPGVLTGTWAASPVKMTQSRFYLGKDDLFWASLDGVPTPFTLDGILAYQPFKDL